MKSIKFLILLIVLVFAATLSITRKHKKRNHSTHKTQKRTHRSHSREAQSWAQYKAAWSGSHEKLVQFEEMIELAKTTSDAFCSTHHKSVTQLVFPTSADTFAVECCDNIWGTSHRGVEWEKISLSAEDSHKILQDHKTIILHTSGHHSNSGSSTHSSTSNGPVTWDHFKAHWPGTQEKLVNFEGMTAKGIPNCRSWCQGKHKQYVQYIFPVESDSFVCECSDNTWSVSKEGIEFESITLTSQVQAEITKILSSPKTVILDHHSSGSIGNSSHGSTSHVTSSHGSVMKPLQEFLAHFPAEEDKKNNFAKAAALIATTGPAHCASLGKPFKICFFHHEADSFVCGCEGEKWFNTQDGKASGLKDLSSDNKVIEFIHKCLSDPNSVLIK